MSSRPVDYLPWWQYAIMAYIPQALPPTRRWIPSFLDRQPVLTLIGGGAR